MRMLSAGLFVIAAVPSLTGCPVNHQSPPARAQEAASELNVNTRFGRMEMAAEKVAPKEREAFLVRRKAWGAGLRVADYEMAGLQMKGDTDAETLVKVAWYRLDEGDLRVTMVKQKWHDFKGDWKLVDEMRADGDYGLFNDKSPVEPRPQEPKRTHFPTIRLNGTDAPPANNNPSAPATIPPPDTAAGDDSK